MVRMNFYGAGHHEAASNFNGQKIFRLKIQQPCRLPPDRLVIIHPVQSGRGVSCEQNR